MKNIILFGAPGAGKGTQAIKIVEAYSLIHLSTGDILRGEIEDKSKLGIAAQEYMKKGELVPDEVVIGMIENKISANKDAKGFIFDGFPRTVEQAIELDKLMIKIENPIVSVIRILVEEEELIRRLANRAIEQDRPDDKNTEIIANRIKVYQQKTLPVATYYQKQNKLVKIKGEGTVVDIFERITEILN